MNNLLSIVLEKRGDDLHRIAFLPLYGEDIRLGAQPLVDVDDVYKVDKRRGLLAIDHVLEKADKDQLAQALGGGALRDAGYALFKAAFGADEAKWQKCFKRLFGASVYSPAARPVRLRIVTADPMLRRLPWAVMGHAGDFLRDAGWTFAIGADTHPTLDVKLDLPTGILLIMPELGTDDDDTASSSHADAIRELVDAHMPERHADQLRVARTREEVRAALREMRPEIIYYYGHGDIAPDREPRLRVPARSPSKGEDPVHWNAHDVARTFSETGSKPLLVYLNGCLTGRGPWQSVASKLAKVAPCVLAHATVAWSEPAREVASRFFRRLFSATMDPVEAAMMRDPHEPTTGAGWLPLLAFEGYRSFVVRYAKPPRHGAVTPADFDRHVQRQIAAATIRELAQKPERRVQGFVVVAPPDNHANEIAAQLHAYAQRQDSRAELTLGRPLDVSRAMFDPGSGAGGAGRLDEIAGRLKVNLGREWRTELRAVLADVAPARIPSRTRVLWLDWGVISRAPDEGQLRDWLAFCSGRLTEACSTDLRIIASLAIETSDVKPTRLLVAKLVAERQYRSQEFRASALEPLGIVEDVSEISDFLNDGGCPPNILDDLASWMLEATDGEYAKLRALIAKAFATTWVDLHHELGAKRRK